MTIYSFDELGDRAKHTARDWFRATRYDEGWWDSVYDDFRGIARILGVELDQIYFTGFGCQGDGACFTGSYQYQKHAPRNILAYAPRDSALHQVANRLFLIQKRNFYRITASIQHQGRYYHEHSMDISVERADDEAEVIDALRDLARWLYQQLEKEYDYLNSDEVIDESITLNEYTFTEDGLRCDP